MGNKKERKVNISFLPDESLQPLDILCQCIHEVLESADSNSSSHIDSEEEVSDNHGYIA